MARKSKASDAEMIGFFDAVRAFIEAEIEGGFGPPGVRSIYYALRSDPRFPYIEKGKEKLVKDRLIAARKRWIEGDRGRRALDPALIADDYSAVEGNLYDRNPRHWVNTLPAYRANPWTSQKNRVIVLCEKAGKAGVVRKACEPTRTPFASMGGDHSISFGMVLAAEIAEWRNQGLRIRVLYVGDHDPSGVRMDARIIKDLGLQTYRMVRRDGTPTGRTSGELSRVAITLDQAHELDIPTEDVKLGGSESERTKQQEYIDRHGDEQVELDAIKSAVLERMIVEAIEMEIENDRSWESRVSEIEGEEELVTVARKAAWDSLDE
jgi:hypothetical protein